MIPSPKTVRLSPGRHATPEDGACAMELSSMLACEPFSDRPATVSPTIAGFVRGYHDHLDPALRQDLCATAVEVLDSTAPTPVEQARVERCVELARRLRSGTARYGHAPLTCELAGAQAARVASREPGLHREVLRFLRELADLGRPRIPVSRPAAERRTLLPV